MIWNEHVTNRNAFTVEQLAQYEGQHVAWSLDGKHILAGDADPLKLVERLRAAGYKSDDYVLSFVDSETYLGGAWHVEGTQEVLLTPRWAFPGQRI